MDILSFVKTTVIMLIVIGVLVAIGFVIYEMRKAGKGLGDTIKSVKDWIDPPDPVMPKQLQDFVNEAVNQPGGYTPWKPTEELDDSYPPSWLTKI